AKKTNNEMSTFADLQKLGMRDVVVFACDLNTKSVKEFSFASTPNVPIAEAARASMSIPLFFEAWQFPASVPDDHLYVDGGTAYNYPVSAFDTAGINPNTLGLYLTNEDAQLVDSGLKYDHVFKYVEAVFEIVLASQRLDFKKDPSDQARTVKVNDFGISGTNFGITQADKDKLYKSGQDSVTKFFAAKA
ncbi:MAG: NTE family protein, partial [Crocinitomicaceae bacterium]